MAKLIKEQKRKLFHTSVYESELQLKKLYIQTCKRLPAHGCKVYQVKELLRGKTKKKWRTCGGRSHDRLQLEFRATRWSLVVPTVAAMREVGLALWEILQELDSHFLEEHALLRRFGQQELVKRSLLTLQVAHSEELEALHKLLHFPEEVALRLAETEYHLFYQVPPIDYLRQVTLDLGGGATNIAGEQQQPPPAGGDNSTSATTPRPSVRSLIKRFNEVSSWVTHLIITQPTHEDRKAVLSCILRVALSCWNIGNFNGAMEIVAGLKSNKLKPFWLSITEKESLPVLEFLSAALMSAEYERALGRALAMPECRVVPFFGAFLRELREILASSPSLVVLAPSGEHTRLEVRPPARRSRHRPPHHRSHRPVFISDYNGEDHYFTRIGPGGLINLDKIYRTQAVMDRIASFHQHYHSRGRESAPHLLKDQLSIHTSSIERSYMLDESEDHDYDLDLDTYRPVQPLSNDHGVSFFPISAPHSGIDHHVLQVLHHGSTAVHWDAEGGSRTALVYVRLERSCATLTWSRPGWSGLRTGAGGGGSSPDYCLAANPEEMVAPGLTAKLASGESAGTALEEGYLDLAAVKEIALGGRDREKDPDLVTACKRYGLDRFPCSECCLALVYGANLSDNRILFLLCPPTLCRMWYMGLCWVVRGLKRQLQLTDRRMLWLKEQYLQLYFEECCCGPMTADAIRVFGGRDWALTGNVGGMSPPDNGTLRRGPSAKFKKKKSVGNIQALKDLGLKQPHETAVDPGSGYLRRPTGSSGGPSPSSVPAPSILMATPRSRSISSDMEVRQGLVGNSPQGSSDNLDKLSSCSPTHHLSSSGLHRERGKVPSGPEQVWQMRHFRAGSITHETQLDFIDFVALFRSFSLRARKDLRDLFEQLAITCRSMSDSSLNDGSVKSSPEHAAKPPQRIGLLTRNSSLDLYEYKSSGNLQKKKIFDAIAAASIVSNCAGVDTSKSQVITLSAFTKFLETRQMEQRTEEEVKALVQRHEPDPLLRAQSCLSFEGFARYLMDKDNYAFISERMGPDENEMDQPLSHYYIASSHNTYLTGHQLKGESSVELYSQVLLTGCRCVELDCWDGDDGSPLIYHGHTFTTKIPFRSVVEAINRSAFVTSPYPVILSIENHCSVQQQARMAHIFQSVFGEKLVMKFLFEADFSEDAQLPSPSQLRYRILIKNKKLTAEIPPSLSGAATVRHGSSSHTPLRGVGGSGVSKQPSSGRASSITSGGSANDDFSDDDDDDDDDDDENLDEKLLNLYTTEEKQMSKSSSMGPPRTDSMSSHDSILRGQQRLPKMHPSDAWVLDDDPPPLKPKKQSSQIAKELSEMVVYIQAIKFRGLNTISPNSSVKYKRSAGGAGTPMPSAAVMKKSSIGGMAMTPPTIITSGIVGTSTPATPTSAITQISSGGSTSTSTSGICGSSGIGTSASEQQHAFSQKRANLNHPCYQCSSLNENTAKKLCRKQPLALVAHTETQLMRTYPAGMRIDSSNPNPLIFWAFGIQMVALNYQTEDAALHLNAAMFEQNGRCGFVVKPSVMWDRGHMMYRRFNPWDKEFDGLHSSHLILSIVSGQYVCQSNLTTSTFVEVEVVGIPVDCNKQKTKTIQRNALNPIWNDTFFFQVMFRDLAFLRFSVLDASTNHLLAQRVLPLKCLRPGYRHVRLRSPQNQPLQLSTLFVYSRTEEESLDYGESSLENGDVQTSKGSVSGPSASRVARHSREMTADVMTVKKDLVGVPGVGAVPVKRRMFFLMVYGVVPEEPYTILKITQESTTQEVVLQALQKAGLSADKVHDYILVEEVARSWEKKDRDVPATQRVLDLQERPLQAQAQWQGEGRFLLKRMGDDPSSRAWLSSIRSTAGRDRRTTVAGGEAAESLQHQEQQLRTWEEADTFLVCVYNVSPEIPYAILKVPLSSCAQDVLAQALVKARRMEDPARFVLVEELEWAGSGSGGGSRQQRVLADDENVYSTQAHWQTLGRFILKERDQVTPPTGRRHRVASNLRTATLERISKGLSVGKSMAVVGGGNKEKVPVQEALSDPTTSRSTKAKFPITGERGRGGSGSGRGIVERGREPMRQQHREVHSEGETLSDDDVRDPDLRATVSRLKKVSLRKLRVWKS
ncbi:1-phosphatidylinositol 4,5-bisphosphate phosphodiesterase epsilon-1 isoform X2 [Anabrus simplex]|uniref:1-phosphatidylinositol 4,5-bisphosphate phosphodiesterase epsilon-1 isoform X2 n=1 Tax=Anabrus simplex TaxID=316456 RepID=UPI0035A266D6